MSDKIDYYEVLGVSQDADGETIKKSYRSLALKYHPDRNPGDGEAEERFKEAAEAYAVLSDSEKRRVYDQYGHNGLSGMGGGGGFGGFGGFEDAFHGFGDIFRGFFGGSGSSGRQGPRRGEDLSYELEIDFVDSLLGTERVISIPKEENCPSCGGSGSRTGRRESCPQCRGQGQVFQGNGFIRMASTCPRCMGQGTVASDPCPDCYGQGRVKKRREINVRIPPGIDSQNRLRYQGRGHQGIQGGPPGDLFVEITVKPHDLFSRERNHVLLEKKIDMTLASLGGELEIPTVEGEVRKVEVPPGSQNGKLLRLEGLGFPTLGEPSRRRGDLIVALNVVVPKDLTERQKELLMEFAELEEVKKGESIFSGIRRKVGAKIKNVTGRRR
ncbi:MAG: molecular chaperone DnaJ [Deltaproteobacteria bacterium]|jgi:molecular chaperone DnaJ|nr:molecular chaperone DnaJ [Deltaproteobacteria bacterium]